ncbi:hypothetical protein RQP46_011286 [Phenoliferia psychrophenolica]
MAPTATLSFHPQPLPRSRPPTSAAAAPNSLTGPLALLPGGGVAVGEIAVPIPRGTLVWRGLGLGEMGRDGGSLWWEGEAVVVAQQGPPVKGVWELGLWNATPHEVLTIHRILLFLPPLPPPRVFAPPLPIPGTYQLPPTARTHGALPTFRPHPHQTQTQQSLGLGAPPPHHPTFRNSLLFIDEATNEIIDVLPLASSVGPPVPPKPLGLRPAKTPPPPATPTAGALLAAQVNSISRKMFPGHNLAGSEASDLSPGADAAAEREMRRIEADGSQQVAQSGPNILAQDFVLPTPSAPSLPEEKEEEDEPRERASEQRRRASLALLDEAMMSAESSAGSTLRIPSGRTSGSMNWRASVASTSSSIMNGSEGGFETAHEHEEEEHSRASSWADLAARISHASPSPSHPEEEQDDNDVTPRPSVVSISHPLEASDGDAVLLQFLGSGKDSTLRMRRVTEEEIGREGLVRAGGKEPGWFGWFASAMGLGGIGEWLGGWWRSTPSEEATSSNADATLPPPERPSTPTSYPTFSFFVPTSSLSSTPVTVTLPSGEQSSFHHVWLRDHCMDERSRHPLTKQRLVDTAKIPADLAPEYVRCEKDAILVGWPAVGRETAYESRYPYSFLQKHAYDPPMEGQDAKKADRKVLWTKDIAEDPPMVHYDAVMSTEEGVYEWLRRIDVFGFCFVEGIPSTPEATETLIRRIAFIRETHYGGFWDFTADLAHGDLAYSDLPLLAHTDTTYFSEPCGLQLFHLLSPQSSHSGGHNLLVDGFRAASLLKSLHPSHYALLSTLRIPSHASGSGSKSSPSGVHMAPLVAQPVFTHDADGELVQIRWNGDDRDVVGGKAFEGKMEEWFEALRVWEGILRAEESELWTVMETGTAVRKPASDLFPISYEPFPSQSFIVARTPLVPGELVLAEAPLLTLEADPSPRAIKAAIANLPPHLQRTFLSLPAPLDLALGSSHSSTLSSGTTATSATTPTDRSSLADIFAFVGENVGVPTRKKVDENSEDTLRKIFEANAFPLGGAAFPSGPSSPSKPTEWSPGVGVFPLLSRFAHSCSPTTSIHWEALIGRLVVFAVTPIPALATLTITLVDPFLPASDRRAYLRQRFGFECRCPTCSADEDKLRLGDARRARIRNIFLEMPYVTKPEKAVRSCEEALELLDEEGLYGFRACFHYDAFQFCVACSDFSSAKKWIRRAWEAYVRERGEDSEDAQLMARYRAEPSAHHATGRLPPQNLREI